MQTQKHRRQEQGMWEGATVREVIAGGGPVPTSFSPILIFTEIFRAIVYFYSPGP